VLFRRDKLSFELVDKPVDGVDNRWIDLINTPPHTFYLVEI
jgi:hypothetical protein